MVRSVSSARVSSLTPPTSSSASRRNAPIAPGTVGMHAQHVVHAPVEVEAHRRTRCAASAPIRPRRGCRPWRCRPPRRPRGSAKGCTSWRTVSGSKTVSPSIITTMSWRAAAMPVLRAAGLPAFGLPDDPYVRAVASASTRSAVPSVEPSSTTIDLDRVVAGDQRAQRRRDAMPARCNAGTMTRDRPGHRAAPGPRPDRCAAGGAGAATTTMQQQPERDEHADDEQRPFQDGDRPGRDDPVTSRATPTGSGRAAGRRSAVGSPTACATVVNGSPAAAAAG